MERTDDRTTAAVEDFIDLTDATETFAEMVARFICHQHPELAPRLPGLQSACATELYMAVQEMAEWARCEAMQFGSGA